MSFTGSRGLLSRVAAIVGGLALAVGLVLAAGLVMGIDSGARPADRFARLGAAGHTPIDPSSMDTLGGSVTVGFNTDCPEAWIDCPDNSWATGSNPDVDSVYVRLLSLNPPLQDKNGTDAESGTTMAALDQQAQGPGRGLDGRIHSEDGEI